MSFKGFTQKYSFFENFEYEILQEFESSDKNSKFLFHQLKSRDINSNGIIDKKEMIRTPEIWTEFFDNKFFSI